MIALEGIEVELSAVVGARTMRLGDVVALQHGALIAMDATDGTHLTLTVGGRKILGATLQNGPDGERRAIVGADAITQ